MNKNLKNIISATGILAVVVLLYFTIALFQGSSLEQNSGNIDSQTTLWSPLPTPPQRPTSTPPYPIGTPRTDVSATEAALEYTSQFLPSKTGKPEVLLTRRIRFEDYPELGLGKFVPSNGSDHELELVLLRGDFDTSNYGITQQVPFKEASYVVVVYDLDQKAITNVTISVYGDEFKNLLRMVETGPKE